MNVASAPTRQRAAAAELELAAHVQVEAVGLERRRVRVERVDAQQQAARRVADDLRARLRVALGGRVQDCLRVLLDDHVRVVERPIVDADFPSLGRRQAHADVEDVGFLGRQRGAARVRLRAHGEELRRADAGVDELGQRRLRAERLEQRRRAERRADRARAARTSATAARAGVAFGSVESTPSP